MLRLSSRDHCGRVSRERETTSAQQYKARLSVHWRAQCYTLWQNNCRSFGAPGTSIMMGSGCQSWGLSIPGRWRQARTLVPRQPRDSVLYVLNWCYISYSEAAAAAFAAAAAPPGLPVGGLGPRAGGILAPGPTVTWWLSLALNVQPDHKCRRRKG